MIYENMKILRTLILHINRQFFYQINLIPETTIVNITFTFSVIGLLKLDPHNYGRVCTYLSNMHTLAPSPASTLRNTLAWTHVKLTLPTKKKKRGRNGVNEAKENLVNAAIIY